MLDSLELILKRLDLADHDRFASVCSSWRCAAVRNPPVNKPLYFALSHDPENLVRRFITSFFPSWKKARFIGALDGWLVILIDRRKLFLLNKGFNSIIPLPPPPNSIALLEKPHLYKAVLSSPPSPSTSSPSSSSSSVECTVVIKHIDVGVFYCRLGSGNSFTRLYAQAWPQDILFYEGRLYVLCYPMTVIIFDHLLNRVSKFDTHSIKYTSPRRLLISGNNLLYVVAGQPSQYSVFRLEGSKNPRVVRVNNAGEDDNSPILISNRYCSLSIPSTKEHKEFRRADNCFQDDFSNFVLDTSKDPNKAKADDPWPLFFVMFSDRGIENLQQWKELEKPPHYTDALISNNSTNLPLLHGRGRILDKTNPMGLGEDYEGAMVEGGCCNRMS